MKVGINNSIIFKSAQTVTRPNFEVSNDENLQNKNINNSNSSNNTIQTTYTNYQINTPQKYTKLGVSKLNNGLEIHNYKLANGHRISIVPMEGSPAIVKNYVNVGSMNETDDIKGISHFLEHMAFNGTTGENGYIKLNTGDSFKKIEDIGGWTNASTSYSKTDYINSAPLLEDSDLETQIKVMAAMTEDLKLSHEMIEKEKGPVCSEINMMMDEPGTIAFDQTTKTLFNIQSSAYDLVGGSVDHIKNLTREDVKAYYDKYYTPDNMNLVVTGDIDPDEVINLVAKNFKSTKTRQGQIYQEKLTPINKTVRKDFTTDKTKSAKTIIAFAGPKINDTKAQIINDIIHKHLYFAECGLNNAMKNLKTSLHNGTEKVSTNPNDPTLLYFEMSSSNENSEKALHLLFKRLSNLKAPSEEYLQIIKNNLLKNRNSYLEYSSVVNEIIGNSILNNDLDYITNYENILKEITVEDIQNHINKYINTSKAAIIVMHPETNIEKLNENYEKASEISFKGRKRVPINLDKISHQTLENNYDMSFIETNNENISMNIIYNFDELNFPTNPAASSVLNYIYSKGTLDMNYEEFSELEEKNDFNVYGNLSTNQLNYHISCNKDILPLALEKLNDKLKTPRITQEEFNKAIDKLNDSFSRIDKDAHFLYLDHVCKYDPYACKFEEIQNGLKTLTLDDVQKLHEYIINNCSAQVSMNIPSTIPELKDIATNEFSKFDKVNKNKYVFDEFFIPNQKTEVLTLPKEVAQADIIQAHRYERLDDVKFRVTENLLNFILNSSHSIGLFNTLREKEHLAYSVHSNLSRAGNSGELTCHILTTTDNKEIGEISYENVQKSINGFHRQINALKNSEYTDEDLETAKRSLKASLLDIESSNDKVHALTNMTQQKDGYNYYNNCMDLIDKITREDIDLMAQHIFANPPIYSIVASKDTLKANEEFLKEINQ